MNIELFWTLLSECIKKVDNKECFNPLGWCTDMAGANMNGLKAVFGERALTKIKICEFHYKQSVNRMASKLGDEKSDRYRELCDRLLNSTIEDAYIKAKEQLESFIDKD